MSKKQFLGTAISNDDPAPVIAPKLEKSTWRLSGLIPTPIKKKAKKKKEPTPPKPSTPSVCPRCGAVGVPLTKDHIVPKWAYKRIPQITAGWMKKIRKEFHGETNIQWMCGPCNSKKSGTIEVSNPLARAFWTKVRDVIDEALKKHEEESR